MDDFLLDRVSVVVQECIDMGNAVQLDASTIYLRSCSVELADVLHEVIVSRNQNMDDDQLSKLLDLTQSCPEMGCQLIKLIDLFDPHGIKNLYGKV